MQNNLICDHSNDRNHFTIIPNIIDDLGLYVYAYRLYGHIKRVAGEQHRWAWRTLHSWLFYTSIRPRASWSFRLQHRQRIYQNRSGLLR